MPTSEGRRRQGAVWVKEEQGDEGFDRGSARGRQRRLRAGHSGLHANRVVPRDQRRLRAQRPRAQGADRRRSGEQGPGAKPAAPAVPSGCDRRRPRAIRDGGFPPDGGSARVAAPRRRSEARANRRSAGIRPGARPAKQACSGGSGRIERRARVTKGRTRTTQGVAWRSGQRVPVCSAHLAGSDDVRRP